MASRFFESPRVPFVDNVMELTFVCRTDVDFGSPPGDPNIAAMWEIGSFVYQTTLVSHLPPLLYCARRRPGEWATLLG